MHDPAPAPEPPQPQPGEPQPGSQPEHDPPAPGPHDAARPADPALRSTHARPDEIVFEENLVPG